MKSPGIESDPGPAALVDHLFRHHAGRLIATLTRIFGPGNLDVAEDLVQEALLKALRQWSIRGVPENPEAWLVRVARNAALDRIRRDGQTTVVDLETLARELESPDAGDARQRYEDEIQDDQLRLMFVACHPALPRASRSALTLKTVGGFGIGEIARAFLTPEATIAQRVVRAKRRIRDEEIAFTLPEPREVRERVASVLEVVYLMFNEGYAAHQGEQLVRRDLVDEALRLGAILVSHPLTGRPETHALSALMCFHAARIPARTDASGRLVLLDDQDREHWDRALIGRGFYHLERSRGDDAPTSFHLEAGIASHHAAAPSFAETDWSTILSLYDRLIELSTSPVVQLNRAVAVAMVRGADAGLDALEVLEDEPVLRRYYLLPATRGELLFRAGDLASATAAFAEAAELACSEPEREFLRSRRDRGRPSPP